MRLRGAAASAAMLMGTVAAVTVGCTPEIAGDGSAGAGATASGGAALTAAESLTVKGRAPKTGYERDKFGTPWADTDSNGCDTRVISMLRRVAEAFSQLMEGMVSCAH
ncbi:hypothetical protein ACIBVL_22230 [Streptomyces sp. NPDC049687]|uniref:hypothetical protein n=1 Tax=Streptomyces sp. NPDC049687 TaxID=3365596 RepID=UPI0037A7BBCA